MDKCIVGREDICKWCKYHHYDWVIWGDCCSHFGIDVELDDKCHDFVPIEPDDNIKKAHFGRIAGSGRALKWFGVNYKGIINLIVSKTKNVLWKKELK